ncbi:phage baseplate assembly protein [Falsiroseomonas tokyonensis]|uniref:Phage baseplate assembly protein n=1 Tax=Falsiroseomonas tokyonensis TaxID=430521 RepID=A0ABV7BV75_9PROT|nr:hypothetical protein [Falsiroseomonas tokyonensis]MBU8538732.1 hypothetical protein [Falsiroseomonas tokyonensis]
MIRPSPDQPALLVDGRLYSSWTDIRVTRGLEQASAAFAFGIARGWEGAGEVWPVLPFAKVELRFGDDLVLTGHIDRMDANIAADSSSVTIAGRSLTGDLVDCMPHINGTEFRRTGLVAIARALAAPIGIQVVEEVDCGEPFALERFERTDTAWQIIERLARMRGVLATDDAEGRLVLTRALTRRASGALVLGENIISASAEIDGGKRFRKYLVLSQSPSAAARQVEIDEPEQLPNGGAQSAIVATAEDPEVPRNRLRIMRAEGDGTAADARARALWAAATSRAQGLALRVEVPGWRQPDGRLWQVNEVTSVNIPWLQLEHDLLVKEVEFTLNAKAGRRTSMTLTPPEALTPEPIPAPRTGSGGGLIWGPRGTFARERQPTP